MAWNPLDQASLKTHRDPPAFMSQVLGLQLFNTMPNCFWIWQDRVQAASWRIAWKCSCCLHLARAEIPARQYCVSNQLSLEHFQAHSAISRSFRPVTKSCKSIRHYALWPARRVLYRPLPPLLQSLLLFLTASKFHFCSSGKMFILLQY